MRGTYTVRQPGCSAWVTGVSWDAAVREYQRDGRQDTHLLIDDDTGKAVEPVPVDAPELAKGWRYAPRVRE